MSFRNYITTFYGKNIYSEVQQVELARTKVKEKHLSKHLSNSLKHKY